MPFFSSKQKSDKKSSSKGSTPSTPSTPTPSPARSRLHTEATNENANASPASQLSSNKNSLDESSSSRRQSALTSNQKAEKRYEPPKIVFNCQLAHGSPTGLISGFSNVKELYKKIADCFEIPPSSILFCTLNTHKIEMNKLLGGQIGLHDLIFAHVKGQTKEIDIVKSEPALGLTITDNGAGYAFIKRIKEGSIIDKLKNYIKIGDHIERINDKNTVGSRHFDVAKMLKDIPVGSTFKLRLVEPNPFGFNIEPPNRNRKQNDLKKGTQTLRFKANGQAFIENIDDIQDKAIERINSLIESYMGISDSELAQQILDIAEKKKNPSDFAIAINKSDIGELSFTDEFLFDIWAAVDDVRAGRLVEQNEIETERL